MADLLSTGVSGLLAFQRALDTTSHNIANASTVGYSRQITEFTTRQSDQSGSGWIGNGVDVSTIKRVYDDFLASQTRASSSTLNYLDTYSTQIARINNLLSDSTTGLSTTLQDFVNAVQSVADTPTSTAARQTLLSQAESLVNRLKSYEDSLKTLNAQVDSTLSSETSAVNSLASSIATLNQKIAAGYAQTGQPPNDLLDQRDALLDELATHLNVTAVEQGDHSINVFVGNGQPLVVGQSASQLTTISDPYDATRKLVALSTPTSQTDITDNISGGSLGGILNFRSQVLDPARNSIGLMGTALAELVNGQQAAGIDLTGAFGTDMFSVGPVVVQSNAANAGSASLGVSRTEVSALTTADYVMTMTSGGWTLQQKNTGAAVAMTGAGTTLDPFVAEGLEIVVSGTAQVGDRFQILPTRGAIGGMSVVLTDPAGIAAAAPIATAATAGNAGNAAISAGEVIDASNAQLRSTVTIEFLDATTYAINGAGSYTYSSGGAIEANGWRVAISGAPAAGDTFTVSDNGNGSGDNRNALLLADVLNQPILGGGTKSLSSSATQFVSEIGVKTNQAQTGLEAQQVVYDESVSSLQSLSGVNLDEEAANLIRYQQAYQAMAQVIAAAQQMFDTLLDATRG